MFRFVALLPFLLFVALRALSHANPPDPWWIKGLYDAGDLDDVLQGVSSLVAVTKGSPADSWLLPVRHERPTALDAPAPRTPASRPFRPRAPPPADPSHSR